MFGIGSFEDIIILIIGLLIWVVPGIVGALIAGNKGRSKSSWFAICVICPLCIILIIVLSPAKEIEGEYQKKKNQPFIVFAIIFISVFFFIVPIFFLLTTTFVKKSGVEVNRPVSSRSDSPDTKNITINVLKDGMIYIEGQRIDIRSIKSRMERFKQENPDGNVVITADKDGLFGVSIEVLDQVRLAQIKNVVVAATKEE